MSIRRASFSILWGLLLVSAPVIAGEVEHASAVTAEPSVDGVLTLLEEGRFEEALADSSLLFDTEMPAPDVRAAHGRVLLRAGRLRESAEVLGPLADDPQAPGAGLISLARLRGFRGHHEEAAVLAERAIERSPDDPFCLFWAAEMVPDRDRSNELIRRYLELAPEEHEDWIVAARGTLGMRDVLGDRQVWRVSRAPERVELPLRRVWNDNRNMLGYVVEARIGPRDKPVKLMLDTGSTGLFLVERMARKRGFEFLAEETAFGGGGDQRHRNRRGLFSSFRLGELRFEDALAGTTKSELEPYGRFHGLLGIQALSGYRATLDLKEQKLILVRDDSAPDDFSGDPFWMVSGQMLVEAEAGQTERGLFLFDTGATWSILSNRFARGLDGVRMERIRGLRGFGGEIEGASVVRGTEVRFSGLTSGAEALRAFDMTLRNAVAAVEVSGYIGLDLLGGTRITIDTVSQEVRVERDGSRPQSKDSSSSSNRSSPLNAAR
jgi:tetratricopeptide (TPR) repeat protein